MLANAVFAKESSKQILLRNKAIVYEVHIDSRARSALKIDALIGSRREKVSTQDLLRAF